MELTDTLEEYLIEQESRLNKLRSFFQDLKLAMDQAKLNREAYIGHPMNTYLMIKRLVNEWRPHVKAIQEEGDAEGKPVNSSKIKLLYGQLHRSSADKLKKKTEKTKFNLAIEVSSVKALKEYPWRPLFSITVAKLGNRERAIFRSSMNPLYLVA